MQFDRIHFYVEDAQKWRDWFVQTMGWKAIASGSNYHTHTEVVSSGSPAVNLVLSSPLVPSSPVAQFLRQHPPGVADLALRVDDLDAVATTEASIQCPIQERQYSQGQLRWCQISGRGTLRHTLVERRGITPVVPDPWVVQKSWRAAPANVTGIDHVVLNVAAGDLEETASWYCGLGFQRQQSFTIQTEQSALYSQVMVHPTSGIQLPINEPRSANSQIQEFLDLNRGAGIQHVALTTVNITQVTQEYRAAGLSFLKIPANYYSKLLKTQTLTQSAPPAEVLRQLNLTVQEWQEIVAQEILLDLQVSVSSNGNQERKPLLLQIFTQPIFAQPTFFFELIERRFQAQGFGEGNFRALFEAIENEQLKRGSLAPDAAVPYFQT